MLTRSSGRGLHVGPCRSVLATQGSTAAKTMSSMNHKVVQPLPMSPHKQDKAREGQRGKRTHTLEARPFVF